MYIFLDFDGVLRRLSSDPGKFEEDLLGNFENVIRKHEHLKIVITSTWRLVYSLSEIRNLFSSDISQKIIGFTPEAKKQFDNARHREILAWLKKNNAQNDRWVAVDDHPEHFPEECPVIITNPDEGFNESITIKLIDMIKG